MNILCAMGRGGFFRASENEYLCKHGTCCQLQGVHFTLSGKRPAVTTETVHLTLTLLDNPSLTILKNILHHLRAQQQAFGKARGLRMPL